METLKQKIEEIKETSAKILTENPLIRDVQFELLDVSYKEMEELAKEMDSAISYSETTKRMSLIIYDIYKKYTIFIKSRVCQVDLTPKF